MINYYGLQPGDLLKRNAYNVMHFTVGREYQVLTLVDGQPRVMSDDGSLVTITDQYNAKYFDLVAKPDPRKLKSGDMIKFTKDYLRLGSEQPYIVQFEDNEISPFVYNKDGKVVYLMQGTYFYKVVGRMRDQMKPNDVLIAKVFSIRSNLAKQLNDLGLSYDESMEHATNIILKGLEKHENNG